MAAPMSPPADHATRRAWCTAVLPRNIFAIGVVSFLTDVSGEMIVPVLPLFLTATLGAPPAAVGLIEGLAESTAALLRIFSGWISDRVGKRKQLVVIGYCFSNLVKPLLALCTVWPQVLAIRFTDRFGKGIRGAPRDALIADSVEPAERGRAFGFHRAMDHLGAIAGPVTALLLIPVLFGSGELRPSEYRVLFGIAAVPAVVSVFVLLVFVREPSRHQAGRKADWSARLDPSFWLLLAIIVLFTLGNSSDAFLLLRAKALG